MTAPTGPLLLIANPRAGTKADDTLVRLEAALTARGVAHERATTTGQGSATRIAREAVAAGTRYVAAVGGDGTVHEVVNGLVDPETGHVAGGVVFAAVKAGSGSDFVRTFGLDRAPEVVAEHLATESTMPIDVGRVSCVGFDGEPVRRLFANIAECGFGGETTRRAAALPRRLGSARYTVATIATLGAFQLVETTVEVDHTSVTEPVSNVVVANAQFFGGGMHVAPRAIPDDGTFNVQVWGGSRRDIFTVFPKVRQGTHLPSPSIREYQSSTVTITSAEPLVLEADGEVLGTTPAIIDMFAGALPLKI